MSSSDLEVSYSTTGRLQVKMFGAGKELYHLITTEKETDREQINKSLPKEIKAALGQSNYERLQQVTYQKRKEIKEKEWAAKKETYKKEMDEKREEVKKERQNLESLENSEALQSEIGKTKARIRILEGEHAKARAKYEKSFPEEKDESNMEEDIQELEDEEVEEREILDDREIIKSVDKQNEVLKSRIQMNMYTSEKLKKENGALRSRSKLKEEDLKLMKNVRRK